MHIKIQLQVARLRKDAPPVNGVTDKRLRATSQAEIKGGSDR